MKVFRSLRERHIGGPRAGGALVLSLLAVIVVALLAGSYMELSSAISKRQGRAADRKQAFYMAEAGLSESFTGMKIGKTGNVGTQGDPTIFGDGLFWVEVEDLGDDILRLESTGMYGTGRATLSLVVQRGGDSITSLGVFAEEALDVPVGSRIDRYDSEVGPYGDQWDGDGDWIGAGLAPIASLGSNAQITVNSSPADPTEIQGDVTPGELQSVTEVGNPTITGATTPRLMNAMLPPVSVPTITIGSGVNHSGAVPYTISSGEHGFSYLTVQPGSEIIVQGPATVVVDDLTLRSSSELQFDTTLGAIDVYVTGELDLRSGSQVTLSSEDPSAVTIQVSGVDSATLGAQGPFFGTVYAPQTAVTVGQSFEVFGAVIGHELILEPGVRIHFDRYLAMLDAASTLPSQVSWRILDFAPMGSGNDPFQILGVNKSSLFPPSDSHLDQWLDITYTDLSGATLTYSGMESGFDWGQVKTVEDATRDGETTELMNTKGQFNINGINQI